MIDNTTNLIQKITLKNLDTNKYNHCIANALNYKVYAESWYLNLVSENKWFCYVLNDYEAVMPVCFTKKMGLPYIIQPTFCQQLGVFYQNPISEEIFQKFIAKLKKNIVRSYAFNDHNTELYKPKGTLKNNYILDLDKDYEAIYKAYNKNTKRNLKKAKDLILSKDFSIDTFLEFKKINRASISTKNLIVLKELLYELEIKKMILKYSIKKNDAFISMVIIIRNNNQLYYLNAVNSFEAKKYFSSHYLINEIIFNSLKENNILDFEGSNISTIGQFFKGFGAKLFHYTNYSNYGNY